MSYVRVGTFDGPVRELASLAPEIRLDVSSSGYGSTSDRFDKVEALYKPYMMDIFPGEWVYSMLAIIKPHGGSIPPHKDGPVPHELTRYHIVLQTNEFCWNFHDGGWQQLEEGGIYTLDPTLVHASLNWGVDPRIHLVVDSKAQLSI